MLRQSDSDARGGFVVMATSDPANVYTLPLAEGAEADPLSKPRGAGAMLVTMGGRSVLSAEARGTRVRVGAQASTDDVIEAARALAERLVRPYGKARRRDVIVETINGERAPGSRWADAFVEAGYRLMAGSLRYYAGAN